MCKEPLQSQRLWYVSIKTGNTLTVQGTLRAVNSYETFSQNKVGEEGKMIYKKWKGRILILLAVALAVGFFYRQADASGNIEGKVLRFHVIANSDSDEDQALKLKVKDTLVEKLRPVLQGAEDLEETKSLVREHLQEIQNIAQDVVDTFGHGEQVRAELVRTYFPVKSYGDCTFPAGNYEALRITIGKASGRNWWCVLYPSLCFVDTVHGVVPESSKEELKNVLTEEEYDSLFQWGESEYQIGWKITDLFKKIFG